MPPPIGDAGVGAMRTSSPAAGSEKPKRVAHLGYSNAHPERDQLAHVISKTFGVDLFGLADLDPWILRLRSVLELHPRADQVAVEDCGQRLGVGALDVLLHLAVLFARAKAAGFGVGRRGLSEHRLRDLLVEPVGALLVEIGARRRRSSTR